MNLSEIFIRRPVTTTLIMLAILLFGTLGYELLPVSDLPNIDYPTITVSASLPGAKPETMASTVATPLEKQFSTISGIDSMSSSSSMGYTRVTLQFNLSRNIDAAAQDVQSAIAAVQRRLPDGMPSPPSYRKMNPADQPVLFLALTSPTLPLPVIDEYAENIMAQRISMVPGVSQVNVWGAQKYAVRVELDPVAMAARQVSADEVATAIDRANANLPTGTMYGPRKTVTVSVNGQLATAQAYNRVVVAYRNGHPVRVGDVARASADVSDRQSGAWYINERSVTLAVSRQPGSNTVAVADAVKALLPKFQASMPPSVSIHILNDRSESINRSVADVKLTLLITLGLVVLVIFLFLRNVRATLIPSLALPMSVVGTFAAMYLLGYSIDNLSLMALTLSVGFVVDDAIVMLENVVRHAEMGEEPLAAALNGSKEVSFTILSMTLSLAAVFIPVLFMGGIVGRLFREFAMTITVAILISGFVSLTLTPMLSHRFLRPVEKGKHGWLFNLFERGFEAMRDFYGWTLRGALEARWLVLIVAVATLAATVWLFVVMPKGFIPSEDRDMLRGSTEAAEGTAYAMMFKYQQAVAAAVKANPNVASFTSHADGNSGDLSIRLIPRAQRKVSADEVAGQLRRSVAGIQAVRVYFQNPPPISVGGRGSSSTYQFTLMSPDTGDLYRSALLLLDKLRGLPDLLDVTGDLKVGNPQVNVEVDRDKAAKLHVSVQDIERVLYSAYGSRLISSIYAANDTYDVIMELPPEYQTDASKMSYIYVRSSEGRMIPLNAVTTVSTGVGPLSVNHSGQLPSVTLSFGLKPGLALGPALDEVQRVARENLPGTVTASFQGTAQAFRASVQGLSLLLLMAIAVIYIVLGILYESFVHPITILSGLPSAALGALLTLLAFGYSLDLYAFVGIILLIGLVKKNGIMMIDFALDAERKENKPTAEAIYQACLVRFRPIMMTTMSALVAGLAIAVGVGPTADARRPLGLAIVGGLVVSQLLTLYVTPAVYVYMEHGAKFLAGRKGHVQMEALPSSRASAGGDGD